MKISKYLVTKDLHDSREEFKVLIFSTRSSYFCAVDKNSWVSIKDGDFANVSQEILSSLKSNKILIPDDEDELAGIIRENKSSIHDSEILYLVVQNTAYCQLGCGYCGQAHRSKSMSLEDQTNFVKMAKKKLANGNFKKLIIGWFGAEPLADITVIESLTKMLKNLCSDFDVVYSAKVVTNGLSLTEKIATKIIDDLSVDSIEITLDGLAEYHDKRRITKNNQPTFDKIYKNLKNLFSISCEKKFKVSVRCNVDTRNHEGVIPLIKKLANDGLQNKISAFYVAPIHSWGNEAHELSAQKEQFADWEIDWLLEMKALGFKIPLLPSRRKEICIAVNPNSELVDPSGYRFNCTEVSLVPAYERNDENIYSLGHISEDLPAKTERREYLGNFYDEILDNKWPCSKCEMLPACGGFCPKEWKEGRAACPSFKFNLQDKMLIYYLHVRDRQVKNKIAQ